MSLLPFHLKGQTWILSKYLKWKKNPNNPNLRKKFKDTFTDQNVYFFRRSFKNIMAYEHNSDCLYGLNMSTRKLMFSLLKISVLELTLFGGMMVQGPLTTCPLQSLLTGLWGLLWVLKPSPCLNVSFGFVLLAIFNYCLSHHRPEDLFSVLKQTQETIPQCLCQRILKKSKHLIE